MWQNTVTILERELGKALYESAVMLGISLVLGLMLYLSSKPQFWHAPNFNRILGGIVNFVRSVPFIILVVFTLPLTFLLTGTKIGPGPGEQESKWQSEDH